MRLLVSALGVMLLVVPAPLAAAERGLASVDSGRPTPFDCCNYHGRVATGEKFDPYAMTAASRTLKLGTIAQVTNTKNGEMVYVRINDVGPCGSKHCQRLRPDLMKRIIDLTPEAADRIGLEGLGPVIVRVCRTVHLGPIPLKHCT